jgi:hypothetical protein
MMRLAPVGLVMVCLALPAGRLSAEPLEKEACETVLAEHGALEAAGVVESLKKGPAWAKANLPAARLKQVQRYIHLQEQLLFRCGYDKIRAKVQPDAEDDAAASTAAAPAPAPDKESSEPPPLPRRKAPAKAAKSAPAPAEAKPAPPPKPKATPQPARAKPKVDDAYRPPAKPAAPAAAPAN